jgi:DNA helicase-2/ATP-dependent DNA helicase PcrA
LFYVGITRAKERLYLTHAFRRTRFGGAEPSIPSSFMAAIPQDVIEPGQTSQGGRQPIAASLFGPDGPVETPAWTRVEQGQQVFHGRFGDGVVLSVTEKGDDQEVVVAFKRHGEKRLLASLAQLSVD